MISLGICEAFLLFRSLLQVMTEANSGDDPWAVPENHLRNHQNIFDRTKALSLDDKSRTSNRNSSNEQQSLGGFSVPKVSGERVFSDLNLRRDPDDGSKRLERILDGNYSNGNQRMSFNPAPSNSFGTQRGSRNIFVDGLQSTKSVDLFDNNGSVGFRATNSETFTTENNFSNRNQLIENWNRSNNLGQFASPASAVDLSNSNPSQFGGNKQGTNGRNGAEDLGGSELERNLETESSPFSVATSFSTNRSFSNTEGVRMQQPFQDEKSPATHTLSLEEREKNFWKQAACRASPFVPMQMATSTFFFFLLLKLIHKNWHIKLIYKTNDTRTFFMKEHPPSNTAAKFGGFMPPASGRPLYGRGLCADELTERNHDIVPSFSTSSQRKAMMDVNQDTYQYGNESFSKDECEKPMPNEEISLLNKILHKKLENLQNGNLEISQARSDPNSPLYSVTSFQSLRLKDELLKALDKMSFYMPSKIQEAALPLLLVEPPMNLIAQAQSGTGKTATFVLTMLSRVVPSNKWPQCLCLAPTYELAMQIGQVVQKMSEFLPEIKIRYAVKGERMSRGEKIEEQIIIGTPGKMLDWVMKLRVIDPSKIICLVLDEADVMISQQGHQDQSIRLHKYFFFNFFFIFLFFCNELERSGAKYQSLLFSATYDESVRSFADSIIKDAVNITLRRDEQTLKNIKQYYVKCANREEKYEAVMNLYGGLTIASAIIFCYTRKSAEWLAARMGQRGHDVTVLHGEMTIEDRARTIQQFKDSVYKVLITTNVCARGIDVSQVSVVINYDPPVTYTDNPQPDYETYIHRIGRTGRFGKAGIAINLVSDDFSLNVIQRIGDYFVLGRNKK
ncbi:DEAD/DEAH box helicase [Onchocerca flexuosa]|uniref:RNA helicase n=2 Tax=Onchocerca flexuosa TaxID=387005 RepID=A0A238C2R8_9BILA|nr:DEAD/DEAH box helicase [Onchocerca flexuosa]